METATNITNISILIAELAKKNGSKIALYTKKLFKISRYTYKDLQNYCVKFKFYLQENNITKGEKVLLWGQNSPEWVIVFLACLANGIIVVPVNPSSNEETVLKYIEQTNPKILVISQEISIQKLKIRTIIIGDLVSHLANSLNDNTLNTNMHIHSEDIAEIVFTSGSTGNPKGVVLTHKNIMYQLQHLTKVVPNSKEYKFLSLLPLSHVFEQIVGLFLPLNLGGTVYYIPSLNVVTILKALQAHKITHINMVPQLLKIFYENIELKIQNAHKQFYYLVLKNIAKFFPLPIRKVFFRGIHKQLGNNLQVISCGGSHLQKKLAQNWENLGIMILEGYGATESTGPVATNTKTDRILGSVGKVIPGMNVKLSEEKEVLIKGKNVFYGYFNGNKEDLKYFTKDKFYKTGDIGSFDKAKYLYIKGRKDFKIIMTSGEKIYPEDIECKLNSHPLISDSCVMAYNGNTELYAFVIMEDQKKLSESMQKVNEGLESHQRIYKYEIWPQKDFPRLNSLKINREAVKRYLDDRNCSSTDAVERNNDILLRQDPVKKLIIKSCNLDTAKSLNEDAILTKDLGLDSLKRVVLVALIEEELGITVIEDDITANTTIKDLRKLLQNTQKNVEITSYPQWPINPIIIKLREFCRRYILFPIFSVFVTDVEIVNKENLNEIPQQAIFIFNHVGHYDSGLVLKTLPPHIRKNVIGVGDINLYLKPFVAFIMYFFGGAYPINKWGGAVRNSLNLLIEFLDQGWSLLIAPEGKISDSGNLEKFKDGPSMLAIESGIPIVPFKILGYERIYKKLKQFPHWPPDGKGRITIKIGKPVRFLGTSNYQKVTEKLESIITNL